MMNPMLINSMIGKRTPKVVSDERLEEIFNVSKTAELMEKIKAHKNYEKVFYNFPEIIGQILGENVQILFELADDYVKHTIILKAMIKCAQKGLSFDEAVQKDQEELLKALEEMTEEELNGQSGIVKIIEVLG